MRRLPRSGLPDDPPDQERRGQRPGVHLRRAFVIRLQLEEVPDERDSLFHFQADRHAQRQLGDYGHVEPSLGLVGPAPDLVQLSHSGEILVLRRHRVAVDAADVEIELHELAAMLRGREKIIVEPQVALRLLLQLLHVLALGHLEQLIIRRHFPGLKLERLVGDHAQQLLEPFPLELLAVNRRDGIR